MPNYSDRCKKKSFALSRPTFEAWCSKKLLTALQLTWDAQIVSSKEPEEPPFVPIQGIPIAPNPTRDKSTRILQTMIDLQVAVEGCIVLQSTYTQSETITALARSCSMFLRKLVLGDRGDRRTRLLSDDICKEADLRFSSIRKIPSDRRTLTFSTDFIFAMRITKLDEPNAGNTYATKPSRQQLVFTIHWPLPGMAEWIDQPTYDDPWVINSESLFDLTTTPSLDCDAWIGQQLVLLNNQGISLGKVLRITANTEGAHSPPMDRLMKPEGQHDVRDKMIADSDAHILSNLRVCGVHYNHAIVIETALYLYQQLAQCKFFERPAGNRKIPLFCFVPENVFSPNHRWLGFAGGLIVSYHGQRHTYNVRAPK